MTMRHNDGPAEARPTFDPAKRYRYTWPGQSPSEVMGDALTRLCRGADHNALNIVEIGPVPDAKVTEPPITLTQVSDEPDATPAVLRRGGSR